MTAHHPIESRETAMSIDHSGSISARAGAGRSRKYHVDLPLWLANVEFARQVQTTGEEYKSARLPVPMQLSIPNACSSYSRPTSHSHSVFDDSETRASHTRP